MLRARKLVKQRVERIRGSLDSISLSCTQCNFVDSNSLSYNCELVKNFEPNDEVIESV